MLCENNKLQPVSVKVELKQDHTSSLVTIDDFCILQFPNSKLEYICRRDLYLLHHLSIVLERARLYRQCVGIMAVSTLPLLVLLILISAGAIAGQSGQATYYTVYVRKNCIPSQLSHNSLYQVAIFILLIKTALQNLYSFTFIQLVDVIDYIKTHVYNA